MLDACRVIWGITEMSCLWTDIMVLHFFPKSTIYVFVYSGMYIELCVSLYTCVQNFVLCFTFSNELLVHVLAGINVDTSSIVILTVNHLVVKKILSFVKFKVIYICKLKGWFNNVNGILMELIYCMFWRFKEMFIIYLYF
jgi:hypothetical protein